MNRLIFGLILGAASSGCMASVEGVGGFAPGVAHMGQAGERISGRLHWPRTYDFEVGAEQSSRVHSLKDSRQDQTRLGVLAGYGKVPRPDGPMLGWELTGHVGAFRGAVGTERAAIGAYLGAEFAAPIRLCRSADFTESDGNLRTTWLLVPMVGGNGLYFGDVRGEVTAGLGVRLEIWPTVIP